MSCCSKLLQSHFSKFLWLILTGVCVDIHTISLGLGNFKTFSWQQKEK